MPQRHEILDVNILSFPYQFLDWLVSEVETNPQISRAKEFVILPMYSTRCEQKYVPKKSGLNQWNADGRKRDPGEVYIPVPAEIHKRFPGFFPPREHPFQLTTPTDEVFTAAICQQGGKALMTNPNKALSDWLLRGSLGLKEGTLLDYDLLLSIGVDGIRVVKESSICFSIDFTGLDSYEKFMQETAVEPKFQDYFVDVLAIPHKTDNFVNLKKVVDLPAPSQVGNDDKNGGRARRRKRR